MILKATCAHCRADFEVPVIDGHLVWDPELTAYRWETTCPERGRTVLSRALDRGTARIILTAREEALEAAGTAPMPDAVTEPEVVHYAAVLASSPDDYLWQQLTRRAE